MLLRYTIICHRYFKQGSYFLFKIYFKFFPVKYTYERNYKTDFYTLKNNEIYMVLQVFNKCFEKQTYSELQCQYLNSMLNKIYLCFRYLVKYISNWISFKGEKYFKEIKNLQASVHSQDFLVALCLVCVLNERAARKILFPQYLYLMPFKGQLWILISVLVTPTFLD